MGNKWRGFMVAAVAAAWLAVPGAVQPASAALIYWPVLNDWHGHMDLTANTLGFVVAATVITGTGDFAALIGTTITFNQCTLPTPCCTLHVIKWPH